jgi:hypothetical protein
MNPAEALAKATLYTDNEIYSLIHLPARAIIAAAGVLAEVGTAYSTLIADKDEVTLILPRAAWEEFSSRLPDSRAGIDYRLITIDLVFDLEFVGFLAYLSRILAEAGVPIMAYSSFERDHLLVPADRFNTAMEALRAAQA